MGKSWAILLFLFSFLSFTNSIQAQQSDDIQTILDKINAIRKKGCQCGKKYMPPTTTLAWDYRLEKAANRHAKDMFLHKNYNHTGTDRSSPDERISDAGFEWEGVSENIAWGFYTFDDALKNWLKSERHCRNLMDPFYTHIGISQYRSCWVQDFGKPLKQ